MARHRNVLGVQLVDEEFCAILLRPHLMVLHGNKLLMCDLASGRLAGAGDDLDTDSAAGIQANVYLVVAAKVVNHVVLGDNFARGPLHTGWDLSDVTMTNISLVTFVFAPSPTLLLSTLYMPAVIKDVHNLDETLEGMSSGSALLRTKIERLQTSGRSLLMRSEERKMADVTKDKAVKLTIRILVPVKDHPKFNFVGKLLGPKGNSLKRLQEETMTKMAILGRGSMRDKQKEEELRLTGDPKFLHLQDDLHVEVTAVAPPAEAHARLAYALTEIRRYLVPDYNDDIRQQQMREIQIMGSSNNNNLISNNNINNSQSQNGAISGSEEGSCSPKSTGSPPPGANSLGGMRGGVRGFGGLTLASPHPALRGLNSKQQACLAPGKEGVSSSRGLGGGVSSSVSSRRSVLSLLTRARAIQQKEQELLDVYHDLPGHSVYDHMADLGDPTADEIAGRVVFGALKVGNTALKVGSTADRARYRHDPY
ncbi:unnamed protein product, partial [Meganyctiphanes norvegica]